ncbi:MAG: VWA domain-containing protein [Myxococcales bacterium]|nr:MAG: VWA domain-containing protein [Myxococcales bacterium]
MSFGAPYLLWLLTLLPLVVLAQIYAFIARKKTLIRLGNPDQARQMIVGDARKWRAAKNALILFALALLIVSLSRPQYGTRTLLLRKRGIDIVIALDFSKSMLAQDVKPNRIERAKSEILRFIEGLRGDRVGIVSFAGETMEFPMTTDYSALRLFFRDLGPNDLPVGGTAIGRALIAAKRLIERSNENETQPSKDQAQRVVLLLTDGEDHEGDPAAAAEELAAAGIKLYVIGIGSRIPERIPSYAPDGTWTGYLHDEQGQVVTTSLSAENEQTLKRLAKITDGQYYRAGKGSVGAAELRRTLRQLKQSERKSRRIVQAEDRYTLFVLAAFLLLFLEALLPLAWFAHDRKQVKP